MRKCRWRRVGGYKGGEGGRKRKGRKRITKMGGEEQGAGGRERGRGMIGND